MAACDGGDQRSPTVVVRPFNRGQEVVGEKEGGREGGGTEMVGSSNGRKNERPVVGGTATQSHELGLGSCITNVPIESGRERNEIDRAPVRMAAADTPRHLK